MTFTDVAAQRGAKTLNANGIDIAYMDVGDGPPLVLLHGALSSTGPAWAGSTNSHVDHFAGFDYFDRDHMDQQPEHGFRPLFGGRPGATTADPDAAERAFQQIPAMAAIFTTMQSDYDGAQGKGHWRTYLGQFFDRTTAGVGHTTEDFSALTMPTLLLAGDRDMFCPVEVACAAYRRLPAGELGVVPGTGHDITTPVVNMMIQFLSAHS